MEDEIDLAKDKAIAIIDSCDIKDHFDNAIQYLDLFYTQFNDKKIYDELLIKLKSRQIELGFY